MEYRTAGESHGQGILALVEHFPAGITIDTQLINAELKRRQGGYGRGERQKIETDTVEIQTGIWRGLSTGAPITLWIKNRDHRIDTAPDIMQPRPGHADLAGSIKYNLPIRPIMERASARETAGRVAAGALAKQILRQRGISVVGYVTSIGTFELPPLPLSLCESLCPSCSSWLKFTAENTKEAQRNNTAAQTVEQYGLSPEELLHRRNQSELYTAFPEKDAELKKYIDSIAEAGDSVGGVIEIRVFGVPIGLGSHVQWCDKLDGKLAQAVMSIQAIKGVEIGLGFESARTPGSAMHDPIGYDHHRDDGFVRKTNNAGGIEGGMSNGQPIILRAAMKPIPTLLKPLDSVDLTTKLPAPAVYERSDVCAVPAASVVVENVVAWEIARECLTIQSEKQSPVVSPSEAWFHL